MADYIANNLKAIRKSLKDVVLPSVDPDDPLALEQLNLTIDYLHFLQNRIDFIPRKCAFDLDKMFKLGQLICQLPISDKEVNDLKDILAEAGQVDLFAARSSELRSMTQKVATAIDTVILESSDSPPELKKELESLVMKHSTSWVEMEISWYAPIAVDPEGPGVRDIGQLLGDWPKSDGPA